MSEAIKEDQRPPRGGWAPGRYFCVCVTCDCYFAGDKRAVSCADCAYGEVSAGSSDSNKTEGREPVGSSEIVSLRGFMGAPTDETLAPTLREQALMRYLLAVLKASEHSTIILGVPAPQANEKLSHAGPKT